MGSGREGVGSCGERGAGRSLVGGGWSLIW